MYVTDVNTDTRIVTVSCDEITGETVDYIFYDEFADEPEDISDLRVVVHIAPGGYEYVVGQVQGLERLRYYSGFL